MQNRSDLYKKMMKSDLRDITDAVIYIGAINQDAQSGAMVEGLSLIHISEPTRH